MRHETNFDCWNRANLYFLLYNLAGTLIMLFFQLAILKYGDFRSKDLSLAFLKYGDFNFWIDAKEIFQFRTIKATTRVNTVLCFLFFF